MSDERIKQIRERLEAENRALEGVLGLKENDDALAAFDANASADIAYLLERVERDEGLLRAWGISLEPAPDLMAALKASLGDEASKP